MSNIDFITEFNKYKINNITFSEYEYLQNINMYKKLEIDEIMENLYFVYDEQAIDKIIFMIINNLIYHKDFIEYNNRVIEYIYDTYNIFMQTNNIINDKKEFIVENIIIPKYYDELQQKLNITSQFNTKIIKQKVCKLFTKKDDIKKNDTKENDTKENDTKKDDTKENDTKKDDIKKNDTKKDDIKKNDTKKNDTKENDTKEKLKTTKKKSIPLSLKRNVWNKHVGEAIGKTLCLCCKLTEITQLNFSCGHIISEFNGGKLKLDNLKPICISCNSSMSIKNMDDFIKEYGL